MPPAFTKQDQIREILKCGKDPVYFIKTYAKIQHPIKGMISFETYDFQDECVRAFEEHRFNIVLKSRQLGLSTVSAAYALWMAIFHKDKNILVIATKLPTAQNFIKKVAYMLHSLPPWLLMPKFEPSKQQIAFSNGSQIKAIPTSEDAGRSESLSVLFVDEAAWIRDFDTLWTGLYPTLSVGGRAILISTPNGIGGEYYKIWTQAEAGVNEFNPIKIMWDRHPEHDQAWFEKECKNLGSKKKISQELLCDFVSSGDTFLQPDDLDAVKAQVKYPLEKTGFDRNIWVWKQPEFNHTYVLSADVARGDAHDYSTFHIIDRDTCEICVEYMGKIPPEKFADILFEWGMKYNEALLAPENNTFGYFVNVKLRDKGYPRLYYYNHRGDPFGYVTPNKDELPGFPTNQKTRVQILTKLEEMIRGKVIVSRSQRLYDQLQAFVWNGNKPMASKDSHDDLIMSLAIGAWLVEGVSQNIQELNMSYAILNATSRQSKDISHMPGNISQVKPVPISYGTTRPSPHVATTEFDATDLSWLYR